ncbi:MAG: 4-hydroxy-tetrahydrodipicolinate reductase [Clostridiales bacterium]|nr:4-hydroxy-tetrahydrodipicolinate reductase [Clostridiales bacterium]
MQILLIGANGKMGQKVQKIAKQNNIKVVCFDKAYCQNQKNKFNDLSQIPQKIVNQINVVLDFSSPEILESLLQFCKDNSKPLVVCSTGHSVKQKSKILNASKHMPIFLTSNTSYGVALVNQILNFIKNKISSFDICLIDRHHKNKKDAPSGTSKSMLEILKNDNKNVQVASFRAGTCVGEHEIILFGNGEQISIKHTAENRELFALGAINICHFIKNKPNGFYQMEDLFDWL